MTVFFLEGSPKACKQHVLPISPSACQVRFLCCLHEGYLGVIPGYSAYGSGTLCMDISES
eukprot:9110453-Ditylum_brightwellii.AAC.1